MAEFPAVQRAWDAGSCAYKAPPRAAVELTESFARSVGQGADVDAVVLWAWLADEWRRWLAYDAAWVAGASSAAAAERVHAADGMRVLLGVARNSAAQAAHAPVLEAHWADVTHVLAYALVFQHMTDPVLVPVVRVLAQLVANAGMNTRALQQRVWDGHVLGHDPTCPDALVRMLSSSDPRTVLAPTLYLLRTIDRAYADAVEAAPTEYVASPYLHDLVHTKAGLAVMEHILHTYDAMLLAEEDTDAAAPTTGEILDTM